MIFIFHTPILALIGFAILFFTKCKAKYIFWMDYAVILLAFFLIPIFGYDIDFITFIIVFFVIAVISPITFFITLILLPPLIVSYLTIGLQKSFVYEKTNTKY